MKHNHRIAGISLLALAITGCAVQTQPIDLNASAQRAQDDLVAIYQDQEPLTAPLTLHEAMARAVKYNLEGHLRYAAAHGPVGGVCRARQHQRIQ